MASQWLSMYTQEVVRSCSQTLHALRVLRCHGMPTLALQGVFRAVVINKLCYSSSAWWGFTTAADRQILNAFIRRCKRQGYCATDLALAFYAPVMRVPVGILPSRLVWKTR